jgi:hypothetical protein
MFYHMGWGPTDTRPMSISEFHMHAGFFNKAHAGERKFQAAIAGAKLK